MTDQMIDWLSTLWSQLQRVRTAPRHLRTDPACVRHRHPRTRVGQWHYDAMRGHSCPRCCYVRDRAMKRWSVALDLLEPTD